LLRKREYKLIKLKHARDRDNLLDFGLVFFKPPGILRLLHTQCVWVCWMCLCTIFAFISIVSFCYALSLAILAPLSLSLFVSHLTLSVYYYHYFRSQFFLHFNLSHIFNRQTHYTYQSNRAEPEQK
jgi:hypothetical protein